MERKRIIIDNRVPMAGKLLAPVADVLELPAAEITREAVADADALIIRTRTRCNADLLAGSRVQFIGTATIGTDHIDLQWCAAQGIAVASAPGSNAPAVAQWVLATIGNYLKEKGIKPSDCRLGIVGVGHVGGIVGRWAEANGMGVLRNDPPRAEAEGSEGFVGLDELLGQSDIVTLHTPLTRSGKHPTHHLIGAAQLRLADRCRLLLNAARGGIIDEAALLKCGFGGDLAIDCWETEPVPNPELLSRAYVATPHIAGYSLEGKLRASAMIVGRIITHFGFGIATPECVFNTPEAPPLSAIMDSYNPLDDTRELRLHPDRFEQLRNSYRLRPELPGNATSP